MQSNNFNGLLRNNCYCLFLIFDFQTYVVSINLFLRRSVFCETPHMMPHWTAYGH